MAESTSPKGNSGEFAKKVQRQLSRSKEKVPVCKISFPIEQEERRYCFFIAVSLRYALFLQVLQRLGKTVETRDNQFELCHHQFNDQQVIILLLNEKKKN